MDMKKQINMCFFMTQMHQDFTCDDFFFKCIALQYLSFSYGRCYNVKPLIVYFNYCLFLFPIGLSSSSELQF
jgi:hypothetical protein